MNGHWLERVFLSSRQRRLFGEGVPVFIFHKIARPPADCLDPFDYESPENFERKLAALSDAGLRSASYDEMVPQDTPPKNGCAISFDDGYLNVARNGLPALARHHARAIQFLVAARLGARNDWDMAKGEVAEELMGVDEVRDWLAAGHEIGSHGLTHRNLKKLTAPEAREEIFASKKKLEDLFGRPIRHFSYPSGRYSPQLREWVAEAGYASACTVQFGVNSSDVNRFELRRIFPLSRGQWLRKILHRLLRKLRA